MERHEVHWRLTMPARGLLIAVLLLTASPQTQPRLPIHVESLVYPPIARLAGIQGDVVLVAQIGSDGRVPSPIGKSGHPMLVQAAQDNLKTWKFQGGEYQEIEITYHFKIEGEHVSGDVPARCEFDLPNSVTIVTAPESTNDPSRQSNRPH